MVLRGGGDDGGSGDGDTDDDDAIMMVLMLYLPRGKQDDLVFCFRVRKSLGKP